ncbi:MAG: ATP-grasp domain-containing protein [Methanoregula sp.]
MINVLITGTGGGVGQSIFKALKLSRLSLRIITTDMHPMGVGIYRGDQGYIVPAANNAGYVDVIIKICNREKIDIVFVGSDPELPVFAENKTRIEKETDAKVVISSPEKIKIGNDKWETYLFLKSCGLAYPESVLPENRNEIIEKTGFPVLIKPRGGSASKDVYIVNNREELEVFVKRVNNPIIQEYLIPEDEEYTSGVVMFEGDLLGTFTMKREIKGGNTYRGIIDSFDEIRTAVEEVAKKYNPFGPSNIQMRLTEKGPVTFEINPRFSGTTGIRAFYHFNEPEAVINYILYNKKEPMTHKNGIVMRYMNEVYASSDEYNHLKQTGKIERSKSQTIDYF